MWSAVSCVIIGLIVQMCYVRRIAVHNFVVLVVFFLLFFVAVQTRGISLAAGLPIPSSGAPHMYAVRKRVQTHCNPCTHAAAHTVALLASQARK